MEWSRSARLRLCALLPLVLFLAVENGFGQPPQFINLPTFPQSKNCRFRKLLFSPDGRYFLAQHDSGVSVLTVDPFRVLFHVPSENVSNAGFTPDSQQVWFVHRPKHVVSSGVVFAGSSAYEERWNIADSIAVDRKEIPLRSCHSSALSPDGRVLACIDTGGTLRLMEVDSGEIILEKKKFGVTWMASRAVPGSAEIRFSPDSRFVVVVPGFLNGATLAWDLREKHPIRLAGALKDLQVGSFETFLTSEQILIAGNKPGSTTVEAKLVKFPTGEVISKHKIPPGRLFTAADPGFVLVQPFKRSVAVEYRTGKQITSDAQAMDVFGNHYVTEQLTDGKLVLYERGKGARATVSIDLRHLLTE